MDTAKEFSQFLMMADLSGYTAMTEVHGSFSAARIVTKFVDIVHQSLDEKTRLAERVGDEVILLSSDPESLLQTALRILEKAEEEPHFPKVHAGIHFGNILMHDGHYFGAALNLTSRLTTYAQGGQIICSREVKEKAMGARGVLFKDLGTVQFKNVKNAVEIFEVTASGKKEVTQFIDPVCRMQLTPDTAHAYLLYKEKTFHFCSADCANKFLEDPEHYVGIVE